MAPVVLAQNLNNGPGCCGSMHRALQTGGARQRHDSAAFLPLAVGCTSNEYVIPHEELARLAATPPPERGGRVRAVQDLAGGRSEPVQMTVAPPPPQFVMDG